MNNELEVYLSPHDFLWYIKDKKTNNQFSALGHYWSKSDAEAAIQERKTHKLFSEHYKLVGKLKRKHEAKQARRFKLIIIGLTVITLCSIWGG